jgi:hypothetical protein
LLTLGGGPRRPYFFAGTVSAALVPHDIHPSFAEQGDEELDDHRGQQ